jgi:peptide/nickel transport system ATP-binding protein
MSLLEVRDLAISFRMPGSTVRAVDGLSFTLEPGQALGIVGESGAGKSQTALALLGLTAPNATVTGSIRFDGQELVGLSERAFNELRGNRIAMVVQDPMTSLNPYMRVGDQIGEVLRRHRGMSKAEALAESERLLDAVKIPAAAERVRSYPHELSGGQRQRVMIAMALACRPDILIADEPTTALDVTVQAQIFDLLRDLQREKGTAILLITHDMGAVAEMADRVMVMYAGRVIEQGTTAQVLGRPGHPYTQGLIDCLPELGSSKVAATDGDRIELAEITGVVPSIWELGSGCAFRERCPHAMPRCAQEVPPLFGLDGDGGHGAACWLHAEDRRVAA